jgi:hypothetical protein
VRVVEANNITTQWRRLRRRPIPPSEGQDIEVGVGDVGDVVNADAHRADHADSGGGEPRWCRAVEDGGVPGARGGLKGGPEAVAGSGCLTAPDLGLGQELARRIASGVASLLKRA